MIVNEYLYCRVIAFSDRLSVRVFGWCEKDTAADLPVLSRGPSSPPASPGAGRCLWRSSRSSTPCSPRSAWWPGTEHGSQRGRPYWFQNALFSEMFCYFRSTQSEPTYISWSTAQADKSLTWTPGTSPSCRLFIHRCLRELRQLLTEMLAEDCTEMRRFIAREIIGRE